VRQVENAEVATVFATYPPKFRRKLLALRELILKTAASTEGVGELEETLKWGEPAYLTSQTKSGSTIRLGWKKTAPTQYAIYFHCQTKLVEIFRELFPRDFKFDGDRRIFFEEDDPIPVEPLSICIATALTYHRNKKFLKGEVARRRSRCSETVARYTGGQTQL